MKFNHKAKVIFIAGLLAGVGVVAATAIMATDSVIPYSFSDGQVLSADVLNDLFTSVKNSTQGYQSESELNGTWNCTTYDSNMNTSAGMPNANFSTDSATGLKKLLSTWTFSSNGTALSVTGAMIGGVSLGQNNTGACPINTNYAYTSKIVESTLMLGATSMGGACTTSATALPIIKVSPYKFRFVANSSVTSCVFANQPPAIPSNLSLSGKVLTWVDNSTDETAFVILKKSSGGAWAEYATVGAGVTSYTDSSGSSGDKYRVKSRNTNGDSLGSNMVLAP